MNKSLVAKMGVSDETFEKQATFRNIIRTHLAICGAILKKYSYNNGTPYLYIDAFAGAGEYKFNKQSITGSPLIFLQEAKNIGIPYVAYAIEQDRELAKNLRESSKKYGKLNVICGDNKEILRQLPVQYNQHGMLYADPKASCPSLQTLNEIFTWKCYEKIDLLIYASATGIKRAHKIKCTKCEQYTGDIYDCHKSLKKYLSVSEVKTAWHWTFVLGCNHPIMQNKFTKTGFINGNGAKEYLERIFTLQTNIDMEGKIFEEHKYKGKPYATYQEYLKHPRFLEVKRQREIIAGGLCELCNKRRCDEPHHLIYPPWGTFDTIDNFIMVCHRCHCSIHGKDN